MAKVKVNNIKGLPGVRIAYFRCPGCDEVHGVNVGLVNLHCPVVWQFNEDVEKPTFSPSLLIRSGHFVPGQEGRQCWCSYDWEEKEPVFSCSVCHSFVNNGQIQFLSDCTHKLAGQTVELPDWEKKSYD